MPSSRRHDERRKMEVAAIQDTINYFDDRVWYTRQA